MAVKPIDYQIMLPRTTEISRMRDSEAHKNQVIAQHQANSFEKKTDGDLKQVNARNQAEQARIREKQREGNSKKQKKEGNETQESNKSLKNKSNAEDNKSTIDIRI
jgi:hypothetical protein